MLRACAVVHVRTHLHTHTQLGAHAYARARVNREMAKSADADDWDRMYSSAVAALNAAGDDVIASSLWCMRRPGVDGVDGCCGVVHDVPHGYYIYVPPSTESPLLSFTERVTVHALNGPVMVTEHAASRLDMPLLCPLRVGQSANLKKSTVTLASLTEECAVVRVSYEEDKERGSMEYFFYAEPIRAVICDLMKDVCKFPFSRHAPLRELYAMVVQLKKTLEKHAPAASVADEPADELADRPTGRPSCKRQRTE